MKPSLSLWIDHRKAVIAFVVNKKVEKTDNIKC
jgi:hypothetical protein